MWLLIFHFLFSQNYTHLEGVPPGFVQYKIEGQAQKSSLQLMGTLTPPTVLLNGEKLPLKEIKNSSHQPAGVYLNGKAQKSQGTFGRFFILADEKVLKKDNNSIVLIADKAYQAKLPYQRHWIEESFTKTLYYLENDKPATWLLQGTLNKNEKLTVKHESKDTVFQEQASIPIQLETHKQTLNLLLQNDKLRRTTLVPVTINKTKHSPEKFFLSLTCEKEECRKPIEISFYGSAVKGLTNPKAKLSINKKSINIGTNGEFEYSYTPQCDIATYGDFNIEAHFDNEQYQYKQQWISPDCQKFNRKNNSRFYFAFGIGHFGFLNSPAPGVKTMLSEDLKINPRLGLGFRIFDKFYTDIRIASLGDYISSNRQHKVYYVDFNSITLGYPYRGRWFGAIGFANYKVGYDRSNSHNFYGWNSKWSAALFLEGGHRFYLSPSWTLNSRVLYSHEAFSFQSNSARKWPFLLFEPIALEYHFL